jgi:hypothetical protein
VVEADDGGADMGAIDDFAIDQQRRGFQHLHDRMAQRGPRIK